MRSLDEVVEKLDEAITGLREEVNDPNLIESEDYPGEPSCSETFLYLTILVKDLAQHVKALEVRHG